MLLLFLSHRFTIFLIPLVENKALKKFFFFKFINWRWLRWNILCGAWWPCSIQRMLPMVIFCYRTHMHLLQGFSKERVCVCLEFRGSIFQVVTLLQPFLHSWLNAPFCSYHVSRKNMGCLGDSLHSVFQDTLVIKHLALQVEGQSFHNNIGQIWMRYDFPRSSIPLWSQPVTGLLVTLPPREGLVEHKCFPHLPYTPYCCPRSLLIKAGKNYLFLRIGKMDMTA